MTREKITLKCIRCKEYNYFTDKLKNIKGKVEPFTIKKFCKRCNNHSIHEEK